MNKYDAHLAKLDLTSDLLREAIKLSSLDSEVDTSIIDVLEVGGNNHLGRIDGNSLHVLTGFLPLLTKFLDSSPESVITTTPLSLTSSPNIGPVLRPYQTKAVELLLEKRRGIVKLPTGTGKSYIIAELCKRACKETKVLVVVTSKELLRQLKDNLVEFGISPFFIGLVGDGNKDWSKPITIGIINSVARAAANLRDCRLGEDQWNVYSREIEQFSLDCGMYIQDEVHLAANNSGYLISSFLTNTLYRLGLSATPWTNNGQDDLIQGLFGPLIYSMEEQTAIEGGSIIKPSINIYESPKAWAPPKLLSLPYSHGIYQKLYDYLIVNNRGRNLLIASIAEKLLKTSQGPIVIIVNKVNTKTSHSTILSNLLKERGYEFPVLHGGTSRKLFSESIDRLRSKDLRGAIMGPGVLKEGINIPSLAVVILAGAGSSDVALIQRVGRCLRTHESKTEGLIIDIRDTQSFFAKQAQNREAVYISTYGREVIKRIDL